MSRSRTEGRTDKPEIYQNSTWTLQSQKQYLADTTLQLSPGESYPTEGPHASAGNEQGGRQDAGQDTAHRGLSTNHVIAIGATVALACLAMIAALCLFGRRLLKQQLLLTHALIQPKTHIPEETQVATDQQLLIAAPQQSTEPRRLSVNVTLHQDHQDERSDDDLRTEMLDTSPPTDPHTLRDQACVIYSELPASPSVSQAVSQQVPPPYSRGGRRFSWEVGSENAYRPSKMTR